MTVTALTFTLEDVATRWNAPRVDAVDIVDWLASAGFIVAVGTDAFVVTARGREYAGLLDDACREWLEVVRA
jgi:hypothetical protein